MNDNTDNPINDTLESVLTGNRKYRRLIRKQTIEKDLGVFLSKRKYLELMPNQKLLATLASSCGVDAVLQSMYKDQNPNFLRLLNEVAALKENKKWLEGSKEGESRLSISLFFDAKTGSLRKTCWCGCGATIESYQVQHTIEKAQLDRLYCHWVMQDGKQIVFSIPLAFILKNFPKIRNKYQIYCHRISCGDNQLFGYYGITGRNWGVRLNEHLIGIRQGNSSKKKFYSKFFHEISNSTKYSICFELVDIDLTYEQAMNWEEEAVDKLLPNEDAILLNMIPGGFKGLKLLHKLGIATKETMTEQELEVAIERFASINPAFLRWADDDFYIGSIFKRRNTLDSPDQVKEVRWLHERGLTRHEIDEYMQIGYDRVCRILRSASYARV